MRPKFLTYSIILFTLYATHCYAYREIAHRSINGSVIAQKLLSSQLRSYFTEQLGYSKADDKVNGAAISKWFENAGAQEDQPFWRPMNHFLDPITNLGFSGYVFGLIGSGDPTAVWAQKPPGQQTPGGAYSWRDAREYFYTALTSDKKEVREEQLANSFRALGQVMHLVSDMSVPEHTRDTSHVFSKNIEPWLEQVLSTDTSLNAKYFPKMSYALNHPIPPDPSLLQQRGLFLGAPIPIANLFDAEKYDGSNPGDTVAGPIGLAEYTNANFFSFNTIFKNYDHPAESSVEAYEEIDEESGKLMKFIRRVRDGEPVEHLAQATVFHRYLIFKKNGYTLENDKIYADYMEKLIPRAAGYAGALVDYFYRGTIELTFPDLPNERFSNIRLKARNNTSTGEEMTAPEEIKLVVRYKLRKEDPAQGKIVKDGDDYRYLVVPAKNAVTAIPKDTPVDLEFDLSNSPLPIWAYDVTLQVVFKGNLGNETGAVAVGRTQLPSVGGDVDLALPDKGIYGITTPTGSFSEFRVKAANVSAGAAAMSAGNIELLIWYKRADQDPFQDQPTDKSPLSPEFYYVRVPEKNGVRSIPSGSPHELVFDLSQKPLPLWATDVRVYVVYTGQVGTNTNEIAAGYRDIAEPTPIDIVNNMDHVCINGSYLVAGSQDAINAVGTNIAGRPNWDIYPHRLKDVYLAFNSTPASSTNYSAKMPDVEPGQYGRVFALTDYGFNYSSSVTVENIYGPLQDVWGLAFSTEVDSLYGVVNEMWDENGEYFDYYPGMYTERGLKSWWYTEYGNPEWPAGTTCDSSGAQPNLAGPVTVEIPQ